MSLSNSEVNARLAELAGWRQVAVTYLGKPIGDWVDSSRVSRWGVPDYCASLDLLRRDVLPLLTEDQWESLDTTLEKQWEGVLASVPHPNCSWAQYILTIQTETIARAALAALEGESHA